MNVDADMFPRLLVVFICTGLARLTAGAIEWDLLNVRFQQYIPLPLTVAEARKAGWAKTTSLPKLYVDLYTWHGEISFMMLFDHNGNVAGVRFGIAVKGIDSLAKKHNLPFPYTFYDPPMYAKQKKNKIYPKDFYYFTILFAPIHVLKKCGRPGTLKLGKDEVALGAYVNLDGTWMEVSRDESGITKQGLVKQKCMAGMGQHYYYHVTTASKCNQLQGFFAGYDKGRLVVVGFANFGNITSKLDYFEHVNYEFAAATFSNAPNCYLDNVVNFGGMTSHVYFKSKCADITCPAGSNVGTYEGPT